MSLPALRRSAVEVCPGCGERQSVALMQAEDFLTLDPFGVVHCRACSLCYIEDPPEPDSMSRYYPDSYFGKRHAVLPGFFMQLRVNKLPPLPKGGRLLDIGCGAGDFVLRCRGAGWQVAGVEQRGAPIMQLKDSLGLDVIELDDLASLADASFDVVTIWHVFEHLAEPREVLRHIRRILKPNGVLVLEVPNFGGWQGRFGGKDWFHLDVPRHQLHFDRGSLEKVITASGLTIQRWQTFSLEYDAFGLVQTILNRLGLRFNALFQFLIGRRDREGRTAVVVSLVLLPLLLAVSLPVSALAAALGEGGVLRCWATPAGGHD